MNGRRKNRRTAISGQFAPRTIEMLQSPAYRALSLSDHRALARLEIELAAHGGKDNGRLPTTFDDFERYGIHRASIAPAIRALEALGFIRITERGRAGNGEWRRPHLFRITFRPSEDLPPTDEWKRIGSEAAAELVASAARKAGSAKKTSAGKRTETSAENRTTNHQIHSSETVTTGHGSESTTTIDISGRGRKWA